MSAVVAGCLTERHLTLFGTIVQWFARYELLMQEIMATVIGSDSAAVMLLTRDLTFSEKIPGVAPVASPPARSTRSVRCRPWLPQGSSCTGSLGDDIVHSAWVAGHPAKLDPSGAEGDRPVFLRLELIRASMPTSGYCDLFGAALAARTMPIAKLQDLKSEVEAAINAKVKRATPRRLVPSGV
jgi:hypothetical protein